MNSHVGLYRAKSKKSKQWIIGYCFKTITGDYYLITRADDKIEEKFLVDETTLGRCSEMLDINGYLIFEGDLLGDVYSVVEYINGAFRVASGILLERVASKRKIVGNIYDDFETCNLHNWKEKLSKLGEEISLRKQEV